MAIKMVDFTTIPDSNIEPGKPIRSIDGLALRDNPIAIAGGAAGAPRIQMDALDLGVVSNEKIDPPTAGLGTLIYTMREAEEIVSAGTSATIPEPGRVGEYLVHCLVAGTITVYFELAKNPGTSGGGGATVFRNFTSIGSGFNFNDRPNYASHTVNVPVNVGDFVSIRKFSSVANTSHWWRRLRIYSNTPNFAVA